MIGNANFEQAESILSKSITEINDTESRDEQVMEDNRKELDEIVNETRVTEDEDDKENIEQVLVFNSNRNKEPQNQEIDTNQQITDDQNINDINDINDLNDMNDLNDTEHKENNVKEQVEIQLPKLIPRILKPVKIDELLSKIKHKASKIRTVQPQNIPKLTWDSSKKETEEIDMIVVEPPKASLNGVPAEIVKHLKEKPNITSIEIENQRLRDLTLKQRKQRNQKRAPTEEEREEPEPEESEYEESYDNEEESNVSNEDSNEIENENVDSFEEMSESNSYFEYSKNPVNNERFREPILESQMPDTSLVSRKDRELQFKLFNTQDSLMEENLSDEETTKQLPSQFEPTQAREAQTQMNEKKSIFQPTQFERKASISDAMGFLSGEFNMQSEQFNHEEAKPEQFKDVMGLLSGKFVENEDKSVTAEETNVEDVESYNHDNSNSDSNIDELKIEETNNDDSNIDSDNDSNIQSKSVSESNSISESKVRSKPKKMADKMNPFVQREAEEEDEEGNVVNVQDDDFDDPDDEENLYLEDLVNDEETFDDKENVSKLYHQQVKDSDMKETSLLVHGIKHGLKKTRKMTKTGMDFLLDNSEDEEGFGDSVESRFLKRLIDRANHQDEPHQQDLEKETEEPDVFGYLKNTAEVTDESIRKRDYQKAMPKSPLTRSMSLKPAPKSVSHPMLRTLSVNRGTRSLLNQNPERLKELANGLQKSFVQKKTHGFSAKEETAKRKNVVSSVNSSPAPIKRQKSVLQQVLDNKER